MGEHFDLGRLREHVERRDALESECRPEIGQVAGEGRWIARDVKERCNRIPAQDLAHFRTQTGRRRIDDYSR